MAMPLAAVALGADFGSGRVLAAFYSQLGVMSWLAVAMTALIFGGFMALIAAQTKRNGAKNMLEVLRRAPGGGLGWMVQGAYLVIVAGGIAMAIAASAHIGALALPVHHARFYAAAVAMTLSVAFALAGDKCMRVLGALFCASAAVFLLALLIFGRSPDASVTQWALELNLENNVVAALIFSLLHASTMVCLASGAAVRLVDGRMRAGRLGFCAGMIMFLLLALGNGVLRGQEKELLALKLPFVALSSGWGRIGFYINAAMIFFASVVSGAGLWYAVIPKRKCPDFIEK